MEEANEVYEKKGQEAYARYQLERQKYILHPGTGFSVVQAILDLKEKAGGEHSLLVYSIDSPPGDVLDPRKGCQRTGGEAKAIGRFGEIQV